MLKNILVQAVKATVKLITIVMIVGMILISPLVALFSFFKLKKRIERRNRPSPSIDFSPIENLFSLEWTSKIVEKTTIEIDVKPVEDVVDVEKSKVEKVANEKVFSQLMWTPPCQQQKIIIQRNKCVLMYEL